MLLRFFVSFLFVCGTLPVFSQYYPVGKMTVDARLNHSAIREVPVAPFSISALVTVGEFKRYLKAIKRDSSATFYKAQLPTSRSIDAKLIHDLFANPSLNNCPMPGVSWTVARNYCQWLNRKSSANGIQYTYDLPLITEMIAYNAQYGCRDTNVLESWTLNCFDESIYEFSNYTNYLYDAKKSDPPVLKRKAVYGGSFQMNYKPNDTTYYYRDFTYEYQDSSSRYIGFRVVRKSSNIDYHSMNIDELTVDYGMVDNQLNGIYTENYSNGKVKVLGCFLDGQRIGIWTVWGKNGEMQVQRNYQNNLICEFIYPKTNNPYSVLYASHPDYNLIRNAQGFYPYLFVEERSVVYSKRIWREISASNEPQLFENIDFAQLIEEIFKNNIHWYFYGEHGDFKTEIPADSLASLRLEAKNWDLRRIQVKEDYFFNSDRLLTDTRQVGISFYENKNDQEPKFTVYFPNIRKCLSTVNVDFSNVVGIENLDDVFFFHDFRGEIVRTSNVYQPSSRKESGDFDLMHELNKFTTEHALWILYGR
jgi:antitoxin component YwqK of YwqJK toxin-antitoxin module